MSQRLFRIPKWLLFLATSVASSSVIQAPLLAQDLYIKNNSYPSEPEIFRLIQLEIASRNFTSVRDSVMGRRVIGSSNFEKLEQEKYERYYDETEKTLNSRSDFDDLTCQSFYTFDDWDSSSIVSISCQEFLEAAACKFSSKANLSEEAQIHCDRYSKYIDQTITKYKTIDDYRSKGDTEIKPYKDAISYRCFFGYNVTDLKRESTLEYCLEAYSAYQEELKSADNLYFVVSSGFNFLEAVALIQLELGRPEEALDLIRSELNYLNKTDLGESFLGAEYSDIEKARRISLIGDIHMQSGSYKEAVESYGELVSNKEKYPLEAEQEYELGNKYALSLIRNGDFDKAEEELRTVIEAQETNGPARLVSFNSDYLRIQEANQSSYDALQTILIREEKYGEALEVADRSRSFLFSRSFQFNEPYDSSTGRPEERSPISIDEIKEEAKKQNAAIVFYSENSVTGIKAIDKNEVDETIYIWVVKPDGTIVFKSTVVSDAMRIGNSQLLQSVPLIELARIILLITIPVLAFLSLRASTKRARSLYASGSAISICLLMVGLTLGDKTIPSTEGAGENSILSRAVASTSSTTRGESIDKIFGKSICSDSDRCLKKMYQLLIEPIEDELPQEDGQQIIFVPDGSLHSLSFKALKSSDGKYLIDSYITRSVPSITALRLLRLRAEKRSVVVTDNLVIGNPDMPKYSPTPLATVELPPLPNSEKEATQVAQLLGTTALVGSEATKEAVVPKLTSANYIHLATHGLPHTKLDSSKLPSFALASATPYDTEFSTFNEGLLDTDELYSIPFNGELAVLSACDTSSGVTTVEGNLSLARPFLVNGIPSVVASLWPVRDDSTAELMVAFYKNLEATSDKATALRDATLLVKAEYPEEPRYWAGFTLIGLSEVPKPDTATLSQVVGKMSCAYKYGSGNLDNNAVSLTKATLSSSDTGFILEVTEETGRKHKLEFNSSKVIQFGYTALPGEDYMSWSLDSTYPYENNLLEVSLNGSFNVGLPVSRRSVCSFEGRLEFVGGSKADFF